jgi:quercetin dioxygenase-like cupin family protein
MESAESSLRTVDEIRIIQGHGPWKTKSGGELNVVLAIPFGELQQQYLHYEDAELARVPGDIRGIRVYTVTGVPKGKIGGTEWHRIREEMVFALQGSFRWECEDLLGNKRTFTLRPGTGIWMPPFVLHTYKAEEDESGLLVVANTLFVPDNPRTHDTYSAEAFRELQTATAAK